MKILGQRLLLSSFLVLLGTSANAAFITLDAADYAVGTDISTASPGATFSTFNNAGSAGARFDPVVVLNNPFGADLAPRAFGHNDLFGPVDAEWNFHNVRFGAEGCLATGNCNSDRFYALHVAFDAPTDFVSVKVHYDFTGFDGSILRAFDATGTAVSTCRVWGSSQDRDPQTGLFPELDSPNCGQIERRYNCLDPFNCSADYTAFISLPNPDIAYVMWGSTDPSATWASISSLSYRSVPEPSTLALLLAGLLLAPFIRRKTAAQV